MKKEDLRKMHVPKRLSKEWEQLLNVAHHLREIEKRDSGSVGLFMVQILSKGGGSRETFQGWKIIVCDVGPVYDKFAEIWIKHYLQDLEVVNRPVRFGIKAHRYLVAE